MPVREPSSEFWKFDPEFWYSRLKSSPEGITEKAAADYLKQNGISIQKKSQFSADLRILARQFFNPLMLLLIGAVILSAFVGELSDVIIISFIILAAGLLGFFQERNAGKVVEKLQSMISVKCTVLRDGKYRDIDASGVVPGDLVLFNAGDIIPADCLLVTDNELYVNESSLTGETFPVRKASGTVGADAQLSKRTNCLWEGTNVVSGKSRALVINTGAGTLFGDIVKSGASVVESAFEKGLREFGYFLMKITMLLFIFILMVNLLSHKGVIESLLFALALAVGMAPELLPAITTIAMSAGAKKMLQQKVIVRQLSSIQNFGEVNLLCTDKTGTLTEGKIKIREAVDYEGKPSPTVLNLACLNAFFETGYSNPIDDALRSIAENPGPGFAKVGEIPFDFVRKRLSVVLDDGSGVNLLVCKGAFENVISVCSKVKLADGSEADLSTVLDRIRALYKSFGDQGFRVISVSTARISKAQADKDDEKDMLFCGFILLEDPVKAGIGDTIGELRRLNIRLKVITGDNRNVALAIGRQVGISDPEVLTGSELIQMSSEALAHMARHTDIFAEVEPQQKERIIQSLRKSFTVAYLGDGINDVSAINAADIGISVDNAVDVAREAADVVLLEKDLGVLCKGIVEGRKTFANTLKYIYISTGSTFGNMFSLAAASMILPYLPMLPKQVLLTNFISDFPYMMITSDNVDEEQVQNPGKWSIKTINRYMVMFGIHSSVFDIITFVTLYFLLRSTPELFRTGWFVESVLTELVILFIIRTHKSFFRSRPGKYLLILTLVAVAFTVLLPYLPFSADLGLVALPPAYLLAIVAIILLYIMTGDWLKVYFFRKHGNMP